MRKLYRHLRTGGVYEELHRARTEADLAPVVVYLSIEHGNVWVRPASEFDDGRFELMTKPVEPKTTVLIKPRPAPQLSGDACTNCGNFSLVRSGTCMTCQACGETTGCS